MQNCDLLISIGRRLDNIITAYNPRGFARAAKKVVIDKVDANEIDKLDMDIELRMVADAGRAIAALAAQPLPATRTETTSWIARCADWKRRYPLNEGQPFPAAGPINHYHFVSALSGCCTARHHRRHRQFRPRRGGLLHRVPQQARTAGLPHLRTGITGYGLPAAIGACSANDHQPMVAVESDAACTPTCRNSPPWPPNGCRSP